MLKYIVTYYLGDDATAEFLLTDSSKDFEWLTQLANDATNHNHPLFKMVVQEVEVVSESTYTPKNPMTLAELGVE